MDHATEIQSKRFQESWIQFIILEIFTERGSKFQEQSFQGWAQIQGQVTGRLVLIAWFQTCRSSDSSVLLLRFKGLTWIEEAKSRNISKSHGRNGNIKAANQSIQMGEQRIERGITTQQNLSLCVCK